MELNAWGDFIAGFSSLPALLWLIIAYFQQSEELRLNTKALEAQQEELRRQVVETALLAQNSGRQAAASEALAMLNKSEAERREWEKKRSAQPVLMSAGGSVSGDTIKTTFQNRGGEVYDIVLTYDGPHVMTFAPTRIWNSNQNAQITVRQKEGHRLEWPMEFSIQYRDSQRRTYSKVRVHKPT
jgi:hypothetical protein